MAGKAIGITLPYGYRGAVTRSPDTIIASYVHAGDEAIQYGEPVVYDAASGGVRKLTTADTTGDNIIGIAVRRMGQPYADAPDGWYYRKGDSVDVLLRGSIAVELTDIAGIAARGKVYVANGANASHAAGQILAASGEGALAIPGAIFSTGKVDADKIAEITILERTM